MGTANNPLPWAVLTYRTAAGEWYCIDLTEAHLRQEVCWDAPDSNRPVDLYAPTAQPRLTLTLQGRGKEAGRAASHQNAIDRTQRMLNDHRP